MVNWHRHIFDLTDSINDPFLFLECDYVLVYGWQNYDDFAINSIFSWKLVLSNNNNNPGEWDTKNSQGFWDTNGSSYHGQKIRPSDN